VDVGNSWEKGISNKPILFDHLKKKTQKKNKNDKYFLKKKKSQNILRPDAHAAALAAAPAISDTGDFPDRSNS
jgi:hypothetical protein